MKKSFRIILLFFILGMTYSCCKESVKWSVKASGIIKEQGITTYMYGSYILVDQSGKTLYALKSDKIKLGDYVNKQVDVRGNLVSGYPVDGGPQYLDVTCIK